VFRKSEIDAEHGSALHQSPAWRSQVFRFGFWTRARRGVRNASSNTGPTRKRTYCVEFTGLRFGLVLFAALLSLKCWAIGSHAAERTRVNRHFAKRYVAMNRHHLKAQKLKQAVAAVLACKSLFRRRWLCNGGVLSGTGFQPVYHVLTDWKPMHLSRKPILRIQLTRIPQRPASPIGPRWSCAFWTASVIGPREPEPISIPSTERTGVTSAAVPVKNNSSAM